MLYSRPQLRLLLLMAALFLVGLGVREWRAGFPELADRLERFDHEEPVADAPQEAPHDGRAAPSRAVPKLSPPPVARPEGAATPKESPSTDNHPVDINHAGAAELSRLPGVGAILAQRIVDERERRGRFETLDALRHVLGVGPKKLAAIRELITIGE